jgi:hypothetical protein
MEKLKKSIKYISLAILFAVAVFATMLFLFTRSNRNQSRETTAKISNEQSGGKVLAEESSAPVATQFFSSPNIRSPQISFGGDAIALQSGEQSLAPEIQDLRSELVTKKEDKSVKFLLSWKTNKLCRSSVGYTKEGQSGEKNISDEGYGFMHSVEIGPLSDSTSYSYTVAAQDKWGNEKKSEKLSFYTGAPEVSIFDILAEAFKDMFGWASR